MLFLLLVFAPLIYAVVGYPWAYMISRAHAGRLALLAGCAVFGVTGELAYMARISSVMMDTTVFALHAILAGILLGRSAEDRDAALRELPDAYGFYLVALLAVVAVPFPMPGLWGGDWWQNYDTMERVFHGKLLTIKLLERPPFFGAAAGPCFALVPDLGGFQVFCAVSSAAALAVFHQLISAALPVAHARQAVWLLACSVFFLQNTANCWSKFLAAAFIGAAWLCLRRPSTRLSLAAAACFAIAVAVHQSSILYGPLILWRSWAIRKSTRDAFVWALACMAFGSLFVLPWELFSGVVYGLEAKVSINPAVAQRPESLPGWLNTLLVALSTVAPWGFGEGLLRWMTAEDMASSARVSKELYWVATAWFNGMAGTLVGLVFPLVVAVKICGLRRLSGWLTARLGIYGGIAVFLAVLGNTLLNPYASSDGSFQTGLVPLGFLFFAAFTVWSFKERRGHLVSAIGWTAILSGLPWMLFELVLSTVLFYNDAMRTAVATGSEGDWEFIQAAHLHPLGLSTFPWLHLGVAMATVVILRRHFKDAEKSNVGFHTNLVE